MRPDKLAVALRPRSGFEAIDVGIRLAQRCARPLFVANLVLVMSICAIAHLIFGVWLDQPDIGLMIVWWLKPLYDRLALHVLSRGVFDATPSAREALRALPSLVRGSGLFRALTLQRASTANARCVCRWHSSKACAASRRARAASCFPAAFQEAASHCSSAFFTSNCCSGGAFRC